MPADAAWCTLCFARLQPHAVTPAQAPEPPVAALAPAPVPFVSAPAPLPAAPAPLPPAPVLSPPAPVLAAPIPPPAPATTALAEPPSPTWPCSSCDERVPLEEMACPRCGTAFMGGVKPDVSLRVPGVGDLVSMSTGGRFGIMAGGGAVFALLLVLVLLVLGHLF